MASEKHPIESIQSCLGSLARVGRSLDAVASLATAGSPSSTSLAAVRAEDLAALLGTLAEANTIHVDRLEQLIHQVAEKARSGASAG